MQSLCSCINDNQLIFKINGKGKKLKTFSIIFIYIYIKTVFSLTPFNIEKN